MQSNNFMKQFLLLFGLIGLMSFGALAQKFGHIDAQNLLLNLPERAAAQTSIETSAMEFEKEMTRMQEDLQTKYAEYQAKAETWPAAIRESKEREIQSLDQGLQEFGTTVQSTDSLIFLTRVWVLPYTTGVKMLPTLCAPSSECKTA
jgi:Skp family chaperone for outer membrane proteins